MFQISHEIIIEENTNENIRYESLSIFAHVDDPDGIEDIEWIYCIADEPEIYFALDPSKWKKVETEGNMARSSNIVMPDRSDFPELNTGS